ncbi:MAG: hypothetical protein H0X62_15455, partial [Bacteroidetes bacterium]|nr:hypothetical protein [Bacteroidota bacterium]
PGVNPGHGKVVITVWTPCVAPPTAGTAIASNINACPGNTINLSLNGNSTGAGMTFQWQSSSNNTTWTNIAGAVNPSYAFQASVPLYFRCEVTCGVAAAFSASVFVNVATPLSGTYTINSALPTGGTNFQSFSSLTNLLSCVGVSGPVTVNMATGSGPYTGGVVIGSITGSSAVNTVTINGNGNVINQGSGNHFLTFNGSSYVTIDSMQFINTTPATGMFGIIITGGSQRINITNNKIDVGDNTVFATGGIIISGSVTSATTAGNNGQYINITGNEIIGGYYGITFNGTASYLNCFGNNISNNIVRDFYLYGIYLSNVDTATIANNDISRMNRSTITTFYGIFLTTSRNVKVLKNKIHDAGIGSYTAYPVYVSNSINTLGFETEFINNAVYNIPSTGSIYGYYVLGTRDYMNFYHNTISIESSGTGVIRGFWASTAPNNHNFRNNLISITGNSTGAKHTMYITATSASFASNNNVLHMGATAGLNHVGYWLADRTSLFDWQSNSFQDANSVNMDPVFANLSGGDVTPLSLSVDNVGAPLGITTDLNNATRSATTPDAGAIEFTGLTGDISLTGAKLERKNICYNPNDTVAITIKNLFGATVDFSVNPLTTVWAVTGPVNSTGTIVINTGTLAVGATLEVKSFTVNMALPGIYTLNAYIQPNAVNQSATNDTLVNPFTSEVRSILALSPLTSTITSPYVTTKLNANSPLFPGGAVKFSELVHFKSSTGAPTGGWPAWVADDDNVEISGVPNSSIAGYVIETWQTNAATVERVHTFPAGAVMSPNGTAYLG